MGVLRAIVNNLFLKSFDTIFMKNEKKKFIKILIFFFIKLFLNRLLTITLKTSVSNFL